MFSQNFRSIATTPGLFKTLSIIRIYSKHWANIRIYSNVYFVMKTNTNIDSSTKIFEYSNIRIFVLIPAIIEYNGILCPVFPLNQTITKYLAIYDYHSCVHSNCNTYYHKKAMMMVMVMITATSAMTKNTITTKIRTTVTKNNNNKNNSKRKRNYIR